MIQSIVYLLDLYLIIHFFIEDFPTYHAHFFEKKGDLKRIRTSIQLVLVGMVILISRIEPRLIDNFNHCSQEKCFIHIDTPNLLLGCMQKILIKEESSDLGAKFYRTF